MSVSTSTSLAAERLTGRSLVPADLFERLTQRIIASHNMDLALAERLLDQALAFLAACARNTGTPLVPSEIVDVGWHTFLLYTRDYAAFCHRLAGRFLHHVPTDTDARTGVGGPATDTLSHTAAAIAEAGFTVDSELWTRSAGGNCTGCHNGCHDDPPPVHQ